MMKQCNDDDGGDGERRAFRRPTKLFDEARGRAGGTITREMRQ